jgi:hypothetical protein
VRSLPTYAALASLLAGAGCVTQAQLLQRDEQVTRILRDQRRQIDGMRREMESLRGDVDEGGGTRRPGPSSLDQRVTAVEDRVTRLEGGTPPPRRTRRRPASARRARATEPARRAHPRRQASSRATGIGGRGRARVGGDVDVPSGDFDGILNTRQRDCGLPCRVEPSRRPTRRRRSPTTRSIGLAAATS